MGELPPTDIERSGSKEAARNFFKEMEEKATGLFSSKRGNLKDLISSGGSAFRNIYNHLKELARPRRPTEGEVYSSDVRNQGVCSACSAFAVTAAFETCAQRTGKSQVGLSGQAPTGLSQQNLLDCGFNSFGLAGCDGGKSFHYMQWLLGGELEMARDWPYVDGSKRWEVPENTSLREGYTSRPGSRRCWYQGNPTLVLKSMVASWDEHTERDIENILLDGHAVVTTMEVTQDFQFYTEGVFMSDQCQNWHLGHYRDYQWNELRPLRHAVVIVGFGTDHRTGLQFWKVKNSWGHLWGESGFFRIVKGYGHCGIGAYIAVAQCEKCPFLGGCQEAQPSVNLSPPANLPLEEVYLGQTTFLSAPIAAQGLLTSSSAETTLLASRCPASRPCKVRCGPGCQRRGGSPGFQCCRPLGGRGHRVYCPRRGIPLNNDNVFCKAA